MSTGAHHHARFMAYGIYYLKMQLLSEKFQMSVKERRNVKRMADFVALFYTEAFLRSRLATLAPASDLKFLSHMYAYKQVDEIAATAAIKSTSNHLWYLCEELVVFSIFDRELPPDLRQQLLNRLLEFPRPNTFSSQKPKFPTFDPSSIEYPRQLLDFVGPRSWLVFELLGLKNESLDWMMVPLCYWEKMFGYSKIEEIIRGIEVVNDCAERAVKLITDFKDVCVNVEEQQSLFQLIEDHRKHFNT